jgi:probable HAF family extracellular repeat protein
MIPHPFSLLKPRRCKQHMLPALVMLACVTGHAASAAAAGTAATRPGYAVTTLPTLGAAFDLSNAAGINDNGWIVGDANVPGSTSIANATEHATLWRHGVITDLDTTHVPGLGGPNGSIGFVARPNDTGLISGNAQVTTADNEGWGLNFGCDVIGDPCAGSQYEDRGFVWKDGLIRPLPTLGGDNALAFGGANDRGEIVGMAEAAVRDPTCTSPQVFDWKPVIWGPRYGHIRQLPLYPGDTVGTASAINDEGQVVGGSGSCGPPAFSAIAHARLWQASSIINLGPHARALGGLYNNLPTAINDSGQVVGWSDLPGDATTHAFLWQDGNMTDLGTLPGDTSSFAYGINDSGQVVGQSCDQDGNCRAFLWQRGSMTDLNSLEALDAANASLVLVNAEGINDRGEIVGFGVFSDTGQGRAYDAVPCRASPTADQSCTRALIAHPALDASSVLYPRTFGPAGANGLPNWLMRSANPIALQRP